MAALRFKAELGNVPVCCVGLKQAVAVPFEGELRVADITADFETAAVGIFRTEVEAEVFDGVRCCFLRRGG